MTRTQELAKMIDHSILHPTLTDGDLKRECEVARKYNIALPKLLSDLEEAI